MQDTVIQTLEKLLDFRKLKKHSPSDSYFLRFLESLQSQHPARLDHSSPALKAIWYLFYKITTAMVEHISVGYSVLDGY